MAARAGCAKPAGHDARTFPDFVALEMAAAARTRDDANASAIRANGIAQPGQSSRGPLWPNGRERVAAAWS